MEFKEFLDKCKEISDKSSSYDDGVLEMSYRNHWRTATIEKPRLYVEWHTGGYSGGNCWNNDEPTYCSSDIENKELNILDKILEMICPKMGFIQYRKLSNDLLKIDSRTESEYYGNTNDYSYKWVDVEDLFNYLKNNKFIE